MAGRNQDRNLYIRGLLEKKVEKYGLAYKCRCKWNARRGNRAHIPSSDPVAMRIREKWYYYHNKLLRITGKIHE